MSDLTPVSTRHMRLFEYLRHETLAAQVRARLARRQRDIDAPAQDRSPGITRHDRPTRRGAPGSAAPVA